MIKYNRSNEILRLKSKHINNMIKCKCFENTPKFTAQQNEYKTRHKCVYSE